MSSRITHVTTVKNCFVESLILNQPSRIGEDVHSGHSSKTSSDSRQVTQNVNENNNDVLTPIKIALLRERSSALIAQSDYKRAVVTLKELNSMEKFKTFDTSLRLAECYIHVKEYTEAEMEIKAVKDIVIASQDLARDICDLVSELENSGYYTRAIILIRIACEIYGTREVNPDVAVNGVFSCIARVDLIIEKMSQIGGRQTEIAFENGIKYMQEMLSKMRGIEKADATNKALKMAWSLNGITYNYNLANQYDNVCECGNEGLKILHDHFGQNAYKQRVCGLLQRTIADACNRSGKYEDAESHYEKAATCIRKAEDYMDEDQRQKDINKSQQGVEIARSKLNKLAMD